MYQQISGISFCKESERGYIFSQAYPTKKYLDICIADNGISTKNLPEAENRGFGIKTSKKMLIDGLSGIFVL